jgi:hypothetical protein
MYFLGSSKAHKSVAGILALSWLLGSSVVAQPLNVSETQGVNLTIYNQNFGLVKDIRTVELKDGINQVRFEDVASQIDPTSVSFQSLTAPNSVVVREQNYQYDVMNPDTILLKSVGKDVKFTQFLAGGQTHEIAGLLLNPPQVTISDTNGNTSTNSQGLVVKTADGIVLNPQGQVQLKELPAGLVSKPSLLWKLESNKAGLHKTEIAYQTGGLNWHCDYVAIVNEDDSKSDVTSWVTLDNKSGASYKDAALKLIAGDVHRVQPNNQMRYKGAGGAVTMAAEMAPQFTEQSFAEYHLYSLQSKTDVNNNETKQLSLFNASNVPVKKNFVYDPTGGNYGYAPWNAGDSQKVKTKLEFQNSEANKLGMPMPKGKVRVYKRDQDGALQFIGEDTIDHTPRGEKVRLYIGDAFDLVGEHKQMSVQNVSDRTQRMTYEISLRNHKDTSVTITAVEHSWGQWKVLSSSHPYTKKDSKTFEFPIVVPANGDVKVTYTIEVKS